MSRGFTRPPNFFAFGDDGPYWVYRHVDSVGSTVYIGVTGQPEHRQSAHRRTSAWFPLVAEIVYHGPMTALDARDLERRLLATEEPPFNTQGTSRGRKALPPERTVEIEAWVTAEATRTGAA